MKIEHIAMYVNNTYQFKDYIRYDINMFPEEMKKNSWKSISLLISRMHMTSASGWRRKQNDAENITF